MLALLSSTREEHKQGAGKSTLGKVMLDECSGTTVRSILTIRIVCWVRFTDSIEQICFSFSWKKSSGRRSQIQQILFRSRSLRTTRIPDQTQVRKLPADTQPSEGNSDDKPRSCHCGSCPGSAQRSWYDVSDERVGDRASFDRLYQDLAAAERRQRVTVLLFKTRGLATGAPQEGCSSRRRRPLEQQRMSSDGVWQWSQACIDADAIIGAGQGQSDLAKPISSEELRQAYNGFCKQNSLRTLSTEGFGKACTEMFGPRRRLPSQGSGIKHRPWGYDVPNGDTWQAKIDARLGIQHSELAGSTAVKRATLCFDPDKFPKQPIPPEGMESLAEGLSEYLGE